MSGPEGRDLAYALFSEAHDAEMRARELVEESERLMRAVDVLVELGVAAWGPR